MRRRAVLAGLAAALAALPLDGSAGGAMDFDVVAITATLDGAPATVKQQARGPRRPRDHVGPDAPWVVDVDRVRFVAAAGATPQRLYLAPAGRLPAATPAPAASAAPAPPSSRVVLAFTVRALDPELVPLDAAPRAMKVAVERRGGSTVPRDGRVKLELELAPGGVVTVRFLPGDAALELRLRGGP